MEAFGIPRAAINKVNASFCRNPANLPKIQRFIIGPMSLEALGLPNFASTFPKARVYAGHKLFFQLLKQP